MLIPNSKKVSPMRHPQHNHHPLLILHRSVWVYSNIKKEEEIKYDQKPDESNQPKTIKIILKNITSIY